MQKEIYLDNSATTPICEEALATYVRVSRENYGNPSSRHRRGQMAEGAIREATTTLLSALDAKGGRLLFTSGGTESNNLAILGRAHAKERYRRGRILTTAGEHSSVENTLRALEKEGFTVVRIPTRGGVLDMDTLLREATRDTILVSMMTVNNETGALYPLPTVAAFLRRACPEAILHADATQSFLKHPLSPARLGADLVTVSSHKIEGPKGVGALWVSDAVIKNRGLAPIVYGGGQGDGLRSGTENVPGICAFAEAARVGRAALAERHARLLALRTHLLSAIAAAPRLAASVQPNLPAGECAPHIVSLTILGFKSEVVLNDLSGRGIYVSSGSACSSHEKSLSTALLAFGKSEAEADATIRVSLSYRNTEEELDALVAALADIVNRRAHL